MFKRLLNSDINLSQSKEGFGNRKDVERVNTVSQNLQPYLFRGLYFSKV